METPLSATVWKMRKGRDGGRLSLDFDQDLGAGVNLAKPASREMRTVVVETVAAYGSHMGYDMARGAEVYALLRTTFDLLRWLNTEGIHLAAVGPTEAFRYAEHCVAERRPRRMERRLFCDASGKHLLAAKEPPVPSDSADEDGADSPTSRISAAHLFTLLKPLALLWRFRSRLPIRLPEDPFPDGLYAVAKRLKLSDGEGPLVPLASGAHLLNGATQWIETLGPLVLAAERARRTSAGYRNRAAFDDCVEQLNQAAHQLGMDIEVVAKVPDAQLRTERMVPFETVLCVVIPHAFLVVSSTYTLARPVEVMKLKTDCLDGSETTGYWQERYIAKRVRAPRNAPVPPVVVAGVELLTELYAERRVASQTNRLLPRRLTNGESNLIAFSSQGLNQLARIVGVPLEFDAATGRTYRWSFAPGQFRRFAACLWVYRFDLPVAALSLAMFHFNSACTRVYLRSKAFRSWVETDSRRLTLDLIEQVAAGSSEFAGLQSVRFKRYVSFLRTTMQLSSVDKAAKLAATRLTDDAGLVASPNAWGFCLAPRNVARQRHAQCMRQGIGVVGEDGKPDSTASHPGVCCACRYFLTHRQRLPYLRKALARQQSVASHKRTKPKERELASRRVIHIKEVLGNLEAGASAA